MRRLRNLNDIEPKPQLDAEATLAPILKREDGLIDWSMDAFRDRASRARFSALAKCAHNISIPADLIIWQAAAEPVNSPASSKTDQQPLRPGTIVEAQDDKLIIVCGDETVLRVTELQPAGGRRISARDFINGAHLKAGAMLQ